jgi:hypothetical protein
MYNEKSNWTIRAFAVDKDGKRFAVVVKYVEDYLSEVYGEAGDFIEDVLGLKIASWHIEHVGTAYLHESYGITEFKRYDYNWSNEEVASNREAFWNHFKPEGK